MLNILILNRLVITLISLVRSVKIVLRFVPFRSVPFCEIDTTKKADLLGQWGGSVRGKCGWSHLATSATITSSYKLDLFSITVTSNFVL